MGARAAAVAQFASLSLRLLCHDHGPAQQLQLDRLRNQPLLGPVNRAKRDVIVKASPFRLGILDGTTLLARHPRCYRREQDIFEPLHYLSLSEQRPGAFDYARPMRQWRKNWPESYHQMLRALREKWPESGRGVQEFVRVLRLHEQYPAAQVERARALSQERRDELLGCDRSVRLLLLVVMGLRAFPGIFISSLHEQVEKKRLLA